MFYIQWDVLLKKNKNRDILLKLSWLSYFPVSMCYIILIIHITDLHSYIVYGDFSTVVTLTLPAKTSRDKYRIIPGKKICFLRQVMSTEENAAIKERLQWQSQMSLSVLWSSVIMQKSYLFSTKSLRTERHRLDTTKLALGVSTQRPGRVLDHDSSTLPPCLCHRSRPEVGQIARLWHNFLNFLLDCDGGRMKARSCVILKGPVRVESPSQMVLCRAPTAAPTNGGNRRGNGRRGAFTHT